MENFMDHAMSVMKQYADKVAFLNEKREMTHAEVDRESGQIYAWLKNQGIGREDFVQVVLPRGPECFSAVIGVLKAGAAFQMTEDSYPAQRIEFIRKDVGAKVLLDEELYRYITQNVRPLEGYTDTDSHDAAFAVYTSGSTGNPKGILHEYGNLELIARYLETKSAYRDEPMVLVSPLNFVASVFYLINSFHALCPMYIVSAELYRDIDAFSEFLRERKVHHLFLPPSYLRQYKDPAADIDWIMVGSEPTNGIYYDGGRPAVLSHYTMSEAGFPVLNMFLDKAYDCSLLGKPVIEEADVHLEADGKRIEGAGEGEVCFKNEYVRGYINLPSKTQAAFRNGYYYTGDLARRDEAGVYFYVGRKDDMFKINGNRVEPGEIESAVRKITGLSTVVAKGFEAEGRSFICLYYLRSEARELNLMEEDSLKVDVAALSDRLPRYMLPTYYIPLDKMPLNERGKTVRRLLMPPDMNTLSGDYVPPANEAERVICEMMAEILGTERIGAESDFYRMGGDSLRAIRLIALAGRKGYSFTTEDLYEARTPRRLAQRAESSEEGKDYAVIKAEELACIYKNFSEDARKLLSSGEMDSYSGSFFTRNMTEVMSAAAGIHFRFTLAEEVNRERLEKAVQEAVKVCPYAAYGLRFNETMPRVTFRKLDDKLPVFCDYLPKTFDEKELEGHFGFLSYAKNDLTVCLCHVITDGFGFMKFVNALFEAYCDMPLQAGSLEQPDWAADVLKYRWPLPKETPPIAERTKDIFRLPEPMEDGEGHIQHFFIDRQSFEAFCHKTGLSPQGAEAYILAKSVQAVHPDNGKTIRVRCPIDTRLMLDVPDTFQNASLPHMYLDFPIEGLSAEMTEAEARRINAEVYSQLSYEYAAYMTNAFAEAALTEDKTAFYSFIMDYIRQSELCVSYIGGAIGTMMSKLVREMVPAYEGNLHFPIMLYFIELGDKISVRYAQGFEEAAYLKMLIKTLKELGIKVI